MADYDRTSEIARNIRRGVRIGAFVFIGLFLLVFLSSSLYTVPAGHRAVIFSRGNGVEPTPVEEGTHFKIPFWEYNTNYEVRSQLHKDLAEGISYDLQLVKTEVAVYFHPMPDRISDIHQKYGTHYADNIIPPAIQDAVKSSVSFYEAKDLKGDTREVAKARIVTAIIATVTKFDIVVDQVSITDFDFSDEFNRANEAKVTAQQRAVEEENKINISRAQAQQVIEKAKGEAEAINIVNEALLASPAYVEWLYAQKFSESWNGQLPQVVGGDANVLMPIQGAQPTTQSVDVEVARGIPLDGSWIAFLAAAMGIVAARVRTAKGGN